MVVDRIDRKFDKPHDYWYVNGQVARSGPEVHAHADRWGDTRGYTIWGSQMNRVLLNRGGTFHEAAEITGLKRLGNKLPMINSCRILAICLFEDSGLSSGAGDDMGRP